MLLPSTYPVTCHTNHVGPGSTFVAIKGFSDDGTKYIAQALEKGATTIIVERPGLTATVEQLCQRYGAKLIVVENARIALAEQASEALGHPSKKLKIIGITGTKGKTTTTYLVHHILHQSGHKTALLSTIKNKIGDVYEPSCNTTPESDYLQMFLAECVKQHIEYVAMEVSSHALSLHRVHGIEFVGIGFTNLAPEHMDFYGTLDDYFAAKAQIFAQCKRNGTIIINGDDAWGKKALVIVEKQVRTTQSTCLSFGQQTDETLKNHIPFFVTTVAFDGIDLTLFGPRQLHVSCPSLFGIFNCYNISMASLLCSGLGLDDTKLKQAIQTFPGVPGRLQRHQLKNGAQAFVDYAHNPSSFNEVLKTLRPFTSHLIVVFGCGGGRDKIKRPVMGQIAAHFGDVVIVTNDNPRFEDPAEIINEIIVGIPPEHQIKIIQEPDRRKAIATAVALSQPHSIIALLGKGHEPYYLVQGQTFHLDDLEEISVY